MPAFGSEWCASSWNRAASTCCLACEEVARRGHFERSFSRWSLGSLLNSLKSEGVSRR